MLERIELESAHRVLVRDLVDLVLGYAFEAAPEELRRARPSGVRVRVVALPRHHAAAERPAVAHADGVVDEAGEDVLAPHLARLLAAEVLVRPGVVMLV